jgi:hypothetical protein
MAGIKWVWRWPLTLLVQRERESDVTDLENDIGTALTRLRYAFAKHGVPCPDVLEYSDCRKGYDAMVRLRHGLGPVNWVMDGDANPFGEAILVGFKLRTEARKIERPGTGEELDDGISGRVFRDDL